MLVIPQEIQLDAPVAQIIGPAGDEVGLKIGDLPDDAAADGAERGITREPTQGVGVHVPGTGSPLLFLHAGRRERRHRQ
jgi:hypothetical protein